MTGSAASGAAPTAATPAAAGSAPRPAGVEVALVARATLQDDALSVGSLRSRQSVMMRPEVAGRVKALGFSDGSAVRRGQVLVQLDDTLQKAEIKQAKAQVSIAQANYKRNQELVAQNFVAQRVLEESSASLQVAEAQLALACARLSRMAIIAPFDGTVGIRNVNLGDFVKDGADLINLEDTGSMYVDFRLPERFQSKLRLRQSVELQLDAMPGRLFKATVEAIDPLFDANGRSIGVRAVLPNTSGEPLAQGGRTGGGGGGGGAGAGGGAAGPRPDAAGKPAVSLRPAAAANRPARPTAAATPSPRPAPAALPVTIDADGCPQLAVVAAASGVGGPAAAPAPRPQAGGAAARPQGNQAPLRPGMFARVTTVF
ncbi:MAG: efflux RND transporter periplasmic adaptor subunit, partial [Burkholderiaceae bacterium]